MTKTPLKRRAFLGATALTALGLAQTGARKALAGSDEAASEEFIYEIIRTEDEWRAMLSTEEYNILRKASTEMPETSPLWNNAADGTYTCRGCDLNLYTSVWKVAVPMGWAFFSQSRENAVLMGIDGEPPEAYPPESRFGAIIEAHCRRCGSHLGHVLTVEGKTLHCVNGTSLQFLPAAA